MARTDVHHIAKPLFEISKSIVRIRTQLIIFSIVMLIISDFFGELVPQSTYSLFGFTVKLYLFRFKTILLILNTYLIIHLIWISVNEFKNWKYLLIGELHSIDDKPYDSRLKALSLIFKLPVNPLITKDILNCLQFRDSDISSKLTTDKIILTKIEQARNRLKDDIYKLGNFEKSYSYHMKSSGLRILLIEITIPLVLTIASVTYCLFQL